MNAALFHKLMAIREKRIMPTAGLVFYMPMKDTITKAIVNGAEVDSGTYASDSPDTPVTFTTFKGVPCSLWAKGQLKLTSLPKIPPPYLISFWVAAPSEYIFLNSYTPYARFESSKIKTSLKKAGSGLASYITSDTLASNQWCFVAIGAHENDAYEYARFNDEIYAGKDGWSEATPLNNSLMYIGGDTTYYSYTGYMAGLRIFNRALSDAEIERLRHEFTPTE